MRAAVSNDFGIVTLAPRHLPRVTELWNRVFPGRRNFTPVDPRTFRRRIIRQAAFHPAGFFLAVEGREVLGFVHAIRPDPANHFIYTRERCGSNGSIAVLAVSPQARRRGVGSALMDRAESYLRELLRDAGVIYAGDYYVPLYHTLEGPHQPFWGDSEMMGIAAEDSRLLAFLTARGYEPAHLPGTEVTMTADLGDRRAPQPPPLASLGLREVGVSEREPWRGQVAWYPPGEPPGYHYRRFGPYRREALALVRGDSITSHLEWYPMRQPGRVALWDFRVAPENRGHRLGSYLLDRFLWLASARGFREVELHTNTENNALAFHMYRDRGFAVAARWRTLEKPP